MLNQQIPLSSNRVLEVSVSEKDDCITVSTQIITNGVRPSTKTCTVTSFPSGRSHSWICRDNRPNAEDHSARQATAIRLPSTY